MAKFNMTWDNTPIQGNVNVTSQEATTKPKTGSTWVTAGFTDYANPIATDKNTSTSPDLPDNVIHQFKVNSICSSGGPMPNIGGVVEKIHFACIVPIMNNTGLSATASVMLTNTDITKVRFTLRKSTGSPPSGSDEVVMAATTVVRGAGNSATITANGLSYSTGYYWEIELFTTLRNAGIDVEVVSSQAEYIGSTCKTNFTTVAPPTCAAVTSLIVTSVGA